MVFHLKQKTWTKFKEWVEERNLYIYEEKEDDSCILLIAAEGIITAECYLDKKDIDDVNDYKTNFQNDITKCLANGNYIEDEE